MARAKTSTDSSSSRASQAPPKDEKKGFVKNYLIAYNALSAIGWSYLLITALIHLSGFTVASKIAPPSTASSTVGKIASFIPFLRQSRPLSAQLEARLPGTLIPLVNRARTLYSVVGPQTTWIQSVALLEVVHSALRWVGSPVQTTAMQVASRIFVVWGVLENFEAARTNALFASLLIAWSITEVVRYSYYASSLLGKEFAPLTWLRYTTFYVLYPLGAGSEAFLNYATLPSSNPVPSKNWVGKRWNAADYTRAILFLIWWPGLYVMYTYMIKQRRKVLGGEGGRKLKSN